MSHPDIDYNLVRYTEEYFYPYFSNGRMTVSEVYIALANGFLDPISLSPITIFECNERLYCTNTRRLTIAKELQRRKKFSALERLPVQYITKDNEEFAEQYRHFVDERLPAMNKKGLDGTTIKLYRDLDYVCCYSLITDTFRDDLDDHIVLYHLKTDISDLESLNLSQCNRCHQESSIIIIKPPNKSSYKFIQNYACRNFGPIVRHTMEKPWTNVTFREICEILLDLKKNASTSVRSMKRSSQSTVFSRRQTLLALHNSHIRREQPISQFLLRCLIVIVLSWLIIIFFPKNDPDK